MKMIPQSEEGFASLSKCEWKSCTKPAKHEIFSTQREDMRRIVCEEHLDRAIAYGFWQETQESKGVYE